MYCSQCGSQLNEVSKFCHSCGSKLGTKEIRRKLRFGLKSEKSKMLLIGSVVLLVALIVILTSSAAKADPKRHNISGAKAAVKQVMREEIGKEYGSDVEKTMSIKYINAKKVDNDTYYFSGDANYKYRNLGQMKKSNMRFQLIFSYYNNVWNVNTKDLWDGYTEEE